MDRLLGRPAGIERASERFMVISFMCPNLGVQLTRPVALTHSLTLFSMVWFSGGGGQKAVTDPDGSQTNS